MWAAVRIEAALWCLDMSNGAVVGAGVERGQTTDRIFPARVETSR